MPRHDSTERRARPVDYTNMRASSLLLLLPLLSPSGCASSAGSLYREREYAQREPLRESLMKDDRALLSEEAIQRLVAARIDLPDRIKLAVWRPALRYPRAPLARFEFLQAQKEYLAAIVEPLEKTGRFTEITHVPQALVPAEPSLTRLREAAALLQADVLLVYESRSELIVDPGGFLDRAEVKSYGMVELFVLDVRTRVIPYADVHDGTHEAKDTREDWDVVDLQRRAQHEGTIRVLREAAASLAAFFARK
jgi:hypothetical protein